MTETAAITPEAVHQRLSSVRDRIARAASRSGRDPQVITLVAVSKRQPVERIVAGVLSGVRHLGENYVQEARDKRPAVEDRLAETEAGRALLPELRWHMIGGLQRNKARDAVTLFHAIESVDRPSLARELGKRAEAAGVTIDVTLQVNLSGEPQKSGAAEDAVPALLEECARWAGLSVRGLMTVPAVAESPEATRPVFAHLRALRDRLRAAPGGERLEHLSMGMSADFEVAIEEGATWVRVGTAIFGPRDV